MRGHVLYPLPSPVKDWKEIVLERYLSTVILSDSQGDTIIYFRQHSLSSLKWSAKEFFWF